MNNSSFCLFIFTRGCYVYTGSYENRNKMSRKVCVLSFNFVLPVFFLVSIIFNLGIDLTFCVSTDNCCVIYCASRS